MIVLHYTATYTALRTYEVLERRGISVHVTTSRDGVHFQHVDDGDRAWHAGDGKWSNFAMNTQSVGVEIVNFGWVEQEWDGEGLVYDNDARRPDDPEKLTDPDRAWYRKEGDTTVITRTEALSFPDHRKGYRDYLWCTYPLAQVAAICELVWYWMTTHEILPENLVGHEHISPYRKSDPGPAFPWRELHDYLADKIANHPKLGDHTYRSPDRIRALQSHLRRLGLYSGAIVAPWGKGTQGGLEDAWKLYAKTYGLRDVTPEPGNTAALCAELRLIPGFDPGRG